MINNRIKLLLFCCVTGWISCNKRAPVTETHVYTQLDSLTDTYLNLQDSLLITWNVMVKDENEKLRSMHDLLQSMNGSDLFDKSQVVTLEQRLEQVERIRFNQKTMFNTHLVEEYDFASNSLISEIISLVESNSAFIQTKELQPLIDNIKEADQRVNYYRSNYDSVAQKFNVFLEKNKIYLKDLDQSSTPEKRPLFQMASEN